MIPKIQKQQQQQFDKNMENLKILIDNYKSENKELNIKYNKIKADYDLQCSVLTDFILSLNSTSLDDIKESFLKMEKYIKKINNCVNKITKYGIDSSKVLFDKLDENSKTVNLLKDNNIDDLSIYIKNNNVHACINNYDGIYNLFESNASDTYIYEKEIINLDSIKNTPCIKNYTKRCKYVSCNNIIINNHIYCNYHYIEENKKLERIKKNTKYYILKISKKNIPIIINHHEYGKVSNLLDYQLVSYFDINKHFNNMYSYLLKNKLPFL